MYLLYIKYVYFNFFAYNVGQKLVSRNTPTPLYHKIKICGLKHHLNI